MNDNNKILSWLKRRFSLRYKESESSQTMIFLSLLENMLTKIENCDIEVSEIDNIIGKYYFDFNLEKTNDAERGPCIGFDDRERQIFRHNMYNIYKDITNHIIYICTKSKVNHTNPMVNDLFDNETEILNIISSHIPT